MVASGALPPSDKVSPDGVAVVDTVPFEFFTSVAFSPTQAAPWRTRTGVADSVSVNEP